MDYAKLIPQVYLYNTQERRNIEQTQEEVLVEQRCDFLASQVLLLSILHSIEVLKSFQQVSFPLLCAVHFT